MISLHASQQLFSAMLDVKHISDSDAGRTFSAVLRHNSRLPVTLAMDIYRNNSIGARQRTLQIIYPVIEKILGENCFNQLAKDFVTASPSTDADLNQYGQAFPDFVNRLCLQQAAFSDFFYLSDLARLEWFYHAAYYAADDAPVPESAFAALVSGNSKAVQLACSKATYSLRTEYPVYVIWQSHQKDSRLNEVAALVESDYLLVNRHSGHPAISRINRPEWMILQELATAQDIQSLIEAVIAGGLDSQQVVPLIMAMIKKGWIRILIE